MQRTLTGAEIRLDKRDERQQPMTPAEEVIYKVVQQRGYNPPSMREVETALFYRRPPIEEIGNKLRSLYKKRWVEKRRDRRKGRLVWIALPPESSVTHAKRTEEPQ